MRILVTGGAGYVGSTLVPMLLSGGHDVRVVDLLRYGGYGLLPHCRHSGLEICRIDICNEAGIAKALSDVDLIIHLAAVVGSPACDLEPSLATATNIDGTRQILALRRRDQGFLLASTCSVYGHAEQDYCDESTRVSPATLYAESKLKGEEMALRAGNSVVYRFPTAFGLSGRMRLDLLPNSLTYQAVVNGEFSLYEPSARRNFIHVTDMARSIVLAIEYWNRMRDEIYNVGHETLNQTKGDLANKIRGLTNCIIHRADTGTDLDQRDYFLSFRRIRQSGFQPAMSMEDGIIELIRVSPLLGISPLLRNI
jgi:nucleoside-diphosphate-sugar epimerase